MDNKIERVDRLVEIRRIFEDNDFSNIELLESWDGDDLDSLAKFLSPEEFQTLLDELQQVDD